MNKIEENKGRMNKNIEDDHDGLILMKKKEK